MSDVQTKIDQLKEELPPGCVVSIEIELGEVRVTAFGPIGRKARITDNEPTHAQLYTALALCKHAVSHYKGAGDLRLEAVLFLDVDGVLNRHPRGGLDSDLLDHLGKIIDEIHPLIVVSSTWRKIPDQLERLRRSIARLGGRFYGCTPISDKIGPGGLYEAKTRGSEINQWLQEHGPVRCFAIVDDEGGMEPLTQHLVKTTSAVGLTEDTTLKIIKKLK